MNFLEFFDNHAGTITVVAVLISGFSAYIAFKAERRANQIEKRIRLAQTFAMYADIGYGFGAQANWHPWGVNPTTPNFKEYNEWLTRFCSYNGHVNKKIQDDYEYVVKYYIEYPKDDQIKKGEIPKRRNKIQEYARERVKELGAELGDYA